MTTSGDYLSKPFACRGSSFLLFFLLSHPPAEFCQRGSLHAILKDWSIPLGFARQLSFAVDAANGMKFLHGLAKPQIHRDLKVGTGITIVGTVLLHLLD